MLLLFNRLVSSESGLPRALYLLHTIQTYELIAQGNNAAGDGTSLSMELSVPSLHKLRELPTQMTEMVTATVLSQHVTSKISVTIFHPVY
jgi:hypothetical protein